MNNDWTPTNRGERYRKYCRLACEQYDKLSQFAKQVYDLLDKRHDYSVVTQALIYGDVFLEQVEISGVKNKYIDKYLAPQFTYRIETTKQELVMFQYGTNGPDYYTTALKEWKSDTAVLYKPEQITHIRLGNINRKGFYPYGVSYFEAEYKPEEVMEWIEAPFEM